ncbi:DUF4326 domain-containing protein [Mesorhizobium sp. M2D.F.Ca.ET.223.01.1.1]|uniref:DUF4326 domain-containing protein n=1 Tax=Mesorhizobium sp. M2D.F.Ca.ET.223.01.1.1 TaxID=2563940 RepID=UPI001091EEEA|nr:DUF4326 domain-containing protein [Mesorhizobium sp. M2D.F.Ca.ET.223.01.1.1]TGR83547.1 DUF4326 domain-containing protein [Mesorhizobium sp. M2D.F.Ca.ET.223.01.1.1]TGT63349.1 DUF4326 domain-containing protein [bacterium M00.F.Ca.ET.159.01.1.1]TGT79166.1 DUF4326 domain-containing protein [bacterium M00.F.Ca.ET.157.01.1.1]
MAERIQLSRRKGWKMPPNTIKVDRTTKWGNPHHWQDWMDAAKSESFYLRTADERKTWAQEQAAEAFAADAREGKLPDLSPLRGKNLACWCPKGQYCHADVLLKMANRPLSEEKGR